MPDEHRPSQPDTESRRISRSSRRTRKRRVPTGERAGAASRQARDAQRRAPPTKTTFIARRRARAASSTWRLLNYLYISLRAQIPRPTHAAVLHSASFLRPTSSARAGIALIASCFIFPLHKGSTYRHSFVKFSSHFFSYAALHPAAFHVLAFLLFPTFQP